MKPSSTKLEEIPVSDIVRDPTLQVRKEMSRETIRNYETAYKNQVELPPLVVTPRPGKLPTECTYLLLSGFHRFEALKNIGQENVKAKIVETPLDASPHLLRWIGGSENLTNGLPMKKRDIRELFRAYVKAGQHKEGRGFKSYRTIAKELALVTHQTLHNWMEVDFPGVFKAMGKADQDIPNKAEGTGGRIIYLPDFSLRNIELFHHDLLQAAKDAENETRWEMREKLQELLKQFDMVAPCEPPLFDTVAPDGLLPWL